MEKSIVVAAKMSLASVGDDSDASSDTELFSSFRGIDKGYNFFRSGHVQQIEMVRGEEFSFVRCNVLKIIPPLVPSQFAAHDHPGRNCTLCQWSNGPYSVMRVIFESSVHVPLSVKFPRDLNEVCKSGAAM